MTLDEIGAPLGLGRLGVGVVGGAQHGDEEFDRAHDPGRRVDERRPLAGVVDKDLLAGRVDLAHRQALPREPVAVVPAERRIPIAVRMLLQILQVQQLQRDAGAPQLGVDPGQIGQRARRRGR